MGVFKNEVGRPSNETIKKRNIIKISILSIIVLFCIIGALLYNNKTNKTKQKEYTIVYNYNYDGKTKKVIIGNNKKVEDLKITRENYAFEGWYLNNKLYDFTKPINKNLILVAKWKKLKEDEVVITFDSDGGTQVENQIIKKGDLIKVPEVPIKDKYVFEGWYINDVMFNFDSVVSENLTLTAKWQKLETNSNNNITTKSKENNKNTSTEKSTYTIIFDSDGGSYVAPQEIIKGSKVTEPQPPTKNGYSFKYWSNGGPLSSTTFKYYVPYKDTILKAIWAKNQDFKFSTDLTYHDNSKFVYLPEIRLSLNGNTYVAYYYSNSINGPYMSELSGIFSNDFNGSISAIEVPIGKTMYYKFNIINDEKGIDIMTNPLKLTGFITTPNISLSGNNLVYNLEYETIYGVEIYYSNNKDGSYELYNTIDGNAVGAYHFKCLESWDEKPWAGDKCAFHQISVPVYQKGKYYKIRLIYSNSLHSELSNAVYYN